MNSTKARPLGFYFIALVLVVTGVVVVSLLAYYWMQGSIANKKFEARIVELQKAAIPVDNQSLESTYRASTDDSETAAWLQLFADLQGIKSSVPVQGVYGLDPRSTNAPFVASGPWAFDEANQRYLDHFTPLIERIRTLAAARKHVYVPKSFDTDFIDLSELNRVRDSAKLLQLDGYMCIRQHKPQQLLDDIVALFNLSESFENEPGIVSCLISLATDGAATDLVQDSLAATALEKAQLAGLQARLIEESAHVPLWKKTIRDERAFTLPLFRNPKLYAAQVKGKTQGIPMRGLDGLKYLELLDMADTISGENFDDVVAKGEEIENELNRAKRASSSNDDMALTLLVFPSTKQMSYSLIMRENRMRTATYAAACSLYMAEHDQAPATLETLPLPHDHLQLSGGKAPGYQVLPDGSVELWYFDLEKDKSTPATPPSPNYPESPKPLSFTWKLPAVKKSTAQSQPGQ